MGYVAETKAELVERIMAESGIGDARDAERALRATLTTLGERLTESEARALARELPESLARSLGEEAYDTDFDAAELYERVRRREGATPGFAREHAQVVLRVLGSALGDELRGRLARVLPEEIVVAMSPRPKSTPPPYRAPSHGPPLTTLATGKPGSEHPLSIAAVPEGQTHSIAREDNPHADTKLSAARGLTQEREREALASGRGGPARPLSEATDERPSPRR
jgi:uncharacterized protein (DUF2267 family)